MSVKKRVLCTVLHADVLSQKLLSKTIEKYLSKRADIAATVTVFSSAECAVAAPAPHKEVLNIIVSEFSFSGHYLHEKGEFEPAMQTLLAQGALLYVVTTWPNPHDLHDVLGEQAIMVSGRDNLHEVMETIMKGL